MSSPNKKSPRSFQCRNGLWTTFEEMARELECSVDYLINDAMKQYARQRGYTNENSQTGPSPAAPSSPTAGAAPPPAPRTREESSGSVAKPLPIPHRTEGSVSVSIPLPAPVPSRSPIPQGPRPSAPPGLAPAPSRGGPPPLAPGPPPLPSGSGARGPGRPTVPMTPGRLPPMPPPSAGGSSSMVPRPPMPQHPGAVPVHHALTVHYQGLPFQVTKDRFIIGRGKTSSDLTIRDPNVSRQHALIEFSGGNFYMVDMGSTNGVEFNGHRVQRKAIQNGDIFRVCDHELFCSLN